ncbi:MAG: FxLYD domain-containing protein, partial [Limisphaerales bacterium]
SAIAEAEKRDGYFLKRTNDGVTLKVPTGAAQAKPVAGKPLTPVQQAALAAARAANPAARPTGAKPGAKPMDKKSAVVKAQWVDGEDDQPAIKPVRCDFCGVRLPPGATLCPDCGTAVVIKPAEPTKPNWFRRVGVGLMLALAIVAAVRWGQLYLEGRPKTGKDGKPVKTGIEILNHSLQTQPGTSLMYVRGMVTNHSDVAWFSVKVEAELLDKAGASLGKVSDTRMVLDPHKLFPFNVAVLDPDAKSYTNLTVSAQR